MNGKQGSPVFVDGKTYSVQRRERIRGRCYLLLEQLAPRPRERWLVFDPAAGGQPRTMLMLPDGKATKLHVRVLRNAETNSLPRILDYDRSENQTRIVTPWMRGVDLNEYLKRIRKKKVDPPEPFHALRLSLELARGLCWLHRYAQVIHGDVKPANLILTRKSSHLRMIDFGSAWPIGMTGFRCAADGVSGTHAAPELNGDGRIDERADQFSTAVVLYQLLTGTVPYDGLGGKAGWPEWWDEANVVEPPSNLRHSPKHLPRKLWAKIDALVLKGLNLDPGQRFAQSCEWVDAIESVFLQLRIHRDAHHDQSTTWDRICHWLLGRFDSQHPEGLQQ